MEWLLLLGAGWLLFGSSSSSSPPASSRPLLARARSFKASGASDHDTWAALAIGGGPAPIARDGYPRAPGAEVVAALEQLRAEAAPAASPSSDRGPIGAFGLYVPDWPKKPTPAPRTNACIRRGRPVCYRTKTDALNVFKEHNSHVLESKGGGLYYRDTSGDMFEPINHKYGLEGRHKVKTMRDALWVAMPSGAPYCLDRLDLAVLNELLPAQEAGGFRLPEYVYEEGGAGQEAYYREQGRPPF